MKKKNQKSLTRGFLLKITGFFFAVFVVNNFFLINIAKLDLSVKNTSSGRFLKIFGNLVTQERRLKDTRSAKWWSLISRYAF